MAYYSKNLVEGAIAGNKDDFAKLLEECMKNILHLATMHTNRQDAEDIAQEVAITLQRKIHTLADSNRFSQWLLVTVRNASIDYMRKGRRSKNNVEIEEYMEKTEYIDNFSVDRVEFLPEKYVENMEFRKIVTEEIGQLAPNQQICLTYYYLHELKRADIVEVTEFTPQQVSNALHSGRKTLKDRLEKRLGETFAFTVVPVGVVPAMVRAFEAVREEMVPDQWCEQVLQMSLDRLAMTGTVSDGGMSFTSKCLVVTVACVTAAGVIGGIVYLGNDDSFESQVSPPVIQVQEEVPGELAEEYPEELDQEEPVEDWREIRTVADMIGESYADILTGFVDDAADPSLWQEFIRSIDAEVFERAEEYQGNYVTYILEKQNKRLLLAEHVSGDGEVRVLYLFGDRSEPVERMSIIILKFASDEGQYEEG